jgi:flagellar hook protein FlgE
MGFTTALSGLNAASNMLSVTGNNIANVNTAGFKKSRSEFADVYASLGGSSKTTPGAGVVVANDAQLFTQGNMQSTDNTLDLAISGDGYFVLGESTSNTLARTFTRAGMFHADENGYIVNNANQPVLAYKANGNTVAEGFSTGVFQPVQIGATQGQPRATTSITTSVNLDSRKTGPITGFDPATNGTDGTPNPTSYTSTSSVTIYDSLGNTHTQTNYFVKMPTTHDDGTGAQVATGYGVNQWRVYTYIDGTLIPDPASPALLGSEPTGMIDGSSLMQYDQSGQFKGFITDPANPTSFGATGTRIDYAAAPTTIAPDAAPMQISLDLTGSTQVGNPFSVNTLSQDGMAIGKLTGLDINEQGVILAHFSNGATRPLGEVALARFPNSQGLSKLGDTKWGETTESGAALYGVATTGSYGAIKSGNLESSNVDLSGQLVTLIVAQQAYQANAQTISTENEVMKTILQIR